jgi:hypothetical protein
LIKTIDHAGKRWNMLTAVRYMNHGKNGARWVFQCHQCGHEKIMPVRFVRNGKRATCGCKRAVALAQPIEPAVVWPFPRVVGPDGLAISPIHRTGP